MAVDVTGSAGAGSAGAGAGSAGAGSVEAGAGTEAEGAARVSEAIRVAVPRKGLSQDLRAIAIVWRRELLRFRADRLRAVSSLIQPVLFLFVLGTGLSSL